MTEWLLLLALSLVIAIGAWFKGRPRGLMFPSDVFFILAAQTVLLTYGAAVIPLLILGADRLVRRHSPRPRRRPVMPASMR